MKSINAADEFETVYIDQGDDQGKLNYEFSEVGKDVLPQRMLVDAQGRFYFLERTPGRVQCFTPEGDFAYSVDLTLANLNLSAEGDSDSSLEFIDMFLNSDSTLGIIVSLPTTDGARVFLVTCDADGLYKSHIELIGAPKPLISIEAACREAAGFIWIFQDEWLVFDQLGNYNSSVKQFGFTVDQRGYAYSDVSPVTVRDRNSKLLATLVREEDPKPDFITYVDAKGFMISWTRGLEEKKTPTSLANPNQCVIFKINFDDWSVEPLATIDVPATEFKFPHPESDQAIPVQVYLKKTSILSGGFLYILAYSDDSFWVNRLDLKDILK